ncbi:MAG: prepilin-type N-terminal cleavage/methylation domain-containing protein [Cellvibrionaceae bacterium]
MMSFTPSHNPLLLHHCAQYRPRSQGGFSLVEIAIGLVIIGLVIGSFITPVSSLRDNARRAEVEQMLEDISDAMIGFAVNNGGRLPCPATNTSNGQEALTGSNCTQEHGFVPAASLGLNGRYGDNNLLDDPWNNPYRYSFSASSSYQICTQAGCPNAASLISSNIAAVILSTGGDGATVSASVDQLENTDGDNNFVKQSLREAGVNIFDDQVHWISPNILTLYLTR